MEFALELDPGMSSGDRPGNQLWSSTLELALELGTGISSGARLGD